MPAPKKNTPAPTGSTLEAPAGNDAGRAVALPYNVISPLNHDGQRYEIGDTLTLTAAQAAALPAGVVELAPVA